MPNALLKLQPVTTPETHEEISLCPLCAASEGSPIADGVAGEHYLPTQSCAQCSTVYQLTPWSSEELLAAYEAERLGDTKELILPIAEGSLGVSDPQFEQVRKALVAGRANNAIALAYTQPGDRVLELGCGGGETLSIQREALGIEAFGVELSEQVTEGVEENRVTTQISELDAPQWSFDELDQIQAFHFIQRVTDPLAWLEKCWDSLAVGGRIVIEVPNLYHPQGPLEKALLRPTFLHTWSESTLPALLARAGFEVERVVSTLTLFAVGRKASNERRANPFKPAMLGHPEQTHTWVSARLRNYAAMEKTRAEIKNAGPNMDTMHQLVHQLMQPAFAYHVVEVSLDLVDFFLSHRAVGLACLLATAASEGPYETELTERFAKLAKVVREEGVAAVGLESSTRTPAPNRNLSQATENRAAASRLAARPKPAASAIEMMMKEIRDEFQTGLPFQIQSKAPFRPARSLMAEA